MPAGSVSASLIGHILKDLGHDVPCDSELEDLIQVASDRVKAEQGLDPATVEFKLVPVDKAWMKDYLARESK